MDVESSFSSSTLHTEKDHSKLMNTPAATSTTTTTNNNNKKKRKRCICLSITAAIILTLGLLFLILGLTVFKAKRPTTTINSLALSDLDLSLDITRLRVLLNVTLDVNLSVTNPNRVGFRYTNGTALLRYRGVDVGEAPVPGGRIGARDARAMNLTLTLMADRILSSSELYSDVLSGAVPLQTYVRIPGRVRVLFSIRVVTYTTCDLEIAPASRTVQNQRCHYRTKL